MTNQEIKDLLVQLVDKELEEEYSYQIDSGVEDKEYLAKLLTAKRYLYSRTNGIDRVVKNLILQEDIEKYLHDKGGRL